MANKPVPIPLASLTSHACAALAALFFACAAQAGDCSIDHCYDGDTCTLVCGLPPDRYRVKVRLWCIDAPEIGQRPWGSESRDWLRETARQAHRVSLIVHDRDRHGRTVGEIIVGGVNLGLAEVRAGKAAMYRRYCADMRYEEAEREARAEKRGIWRTAGDQQTPWEWRRDHKGYLSP